MSDLVQQGEARVVPMVCPSCDARVEVAETTYDMIGHRLRNIVIRGCPPHDAACGLPCVKGIDVRDPPARVHTREGCNVCVSAKFHRLAMLLCEYFDGGVSLGVERVDEILCDVRKIVNDEPVEVV